jgi:hypothetical protein
MSVGTREILLTQRSTMGALEDKANKVMNKAIDGKLYTPCGNAYFADLRYGY